MNIDERISLIKEVAEELISEDELRSLLQSKKKVVAYDGFEPSGRIHIAQGLMRAITVNKLTSAGVTFRFWVADWFAYLNNKMDGDLNKIRLVGEYFIEVWKASGMNLDKVEFVWASEFITKNPDYWSTVMKLSKHATVQRVLRCGQIMGRKESAANPASYVMYPLMQAADIHHLGANIAQLGMDQRKVNMLARDVFPKIGLTPPIALHHHMLMGLKPPKGAGTGIDAAISKKMSKSDPSSAVFMDDDEAAIKSKFKKAFCPAGTVEDNPVLEYLKYIVFELKNSLIIERPEKYGGKLEYHTYKDIEKAFVNSEIHPLDLKTATAKAINELLEPVRKHFQTNKKAKELLKKVEKIVS